MSEETPEHTDAAEAVVVRFGTSRYAVLLSRVAEVGRVPVITRVPGVPDWLAGVANWRGRILAAVDLRARLGADSGPLGPAARLVVLGAHSASVGLLVDAVEGTTGVHDVAPVPTGLGAAGDLVSGQLPRPDGPVAVLDVDAVLRLRETLPRPRRSA